MSSKLNFFAVFVLKAALTFAEELQAAEPQVDSKIPGSENQTGPVSGTPFEFKMENYKTEFLIVLGIFIYLQAYFYGSSQNVKILRKIEPYIKEVLAEQFTEVGDGKVLFEADSPSDILFWASGRRNCKALQGHIQLKTRQDLIGLANDFLASNDEQVSLEIILDNAKVPDFIFGVVQKSKAKMLSKDRFDIEAFTKQVSHEKLDQKFVALTETNDTVESIIVNSGLCEYIDNKNGLLTSVVISDQPETKPDRLDFSKTKRLLATIKLPKTGDLKGYALFKETVGFVLHLVDFISNSITLRSETVKKLQKAREGAYRDLVRREEKRKQEELSKALAEKKKIEAESIQRLPVDQRRKAEEKLKAKQNKKSRNRVVRS
ncbi:hypothetical protein BB559_006621 [Furculomyces boomerangus]|uniref:Coiled-coil domain-containing protein 47 n=2 Tax=Harpellales TaxID=61421 RepID=A0A2T9XYL1_9FUNG|nr:hypothetical protein BB559_007157 [Furculomyces boomerangus]PVU86173.1 hypothetical protein BB559_006621 [Furculomyces boomerangus]PVZ97380.1 hypothetical protein BB558_006660 [Smittium angustum]